MTRDDLFNTNASIVAALIEVPLPPAELARLVSPRAAVVLLRQR
jgi:hypothetical protein